MKVAVPNYFLQKRPGSIYTVDGVYIKRAGSSLKTHFVRNTMHGLLVVLEGSKEIGSSQRSIRLEAPSAAFFMQGNYFSSRNAKDYRALAIYFDEGFISKFSAIFDNGRVERKVENMLHIGCGRRSGAVAAAETLWRDLDGRTDLFEELFESRIETLFWELIALKPKECALFFQKIAAQSGRRFAKTLLDNLDIIDSVADMSKLLRMSPAHFHRRFKEEFGVSAKKWLRSKRLQKAAALLAQGGVSVSDVAAECGYSSPSSFIFAFKNYFGSTPKEFMIKNRHF